MKKLIKSIVFCSTLLFSISASAERLVLPNNVIGFSSAKGQELLKNAPKKYSQQYWKLAQYFTTEYGTSFCGPASSVMVLNALELEPALAPDHFDYTIFNQTNIFYNKQLIKDGINPDRIYAHGLPIDETAEIIEAQNTIGKKAAAKVMRANQFGDEKDFKKILLESMTKGKYIIINYNRADMGAEGGGHFSPLAAYSKTTDRWLVMDVARYKYEPAWVKTSDLYKAIQTDDTESHKPRGIIIVSIADLK